MQSTDFYEVLGNIGEQSTETIRIKFSGCLIVVVQKYLKCVVRVQQFQIQTHWIEPANRCKNETLLNFKFSPDGEFLIVSTHAPQDIYLYEIIND